MSDVYSQLETGQIRVLILRPGAFNDDIRISLCTYTLEGSGTKEPYEAVSYVWGSTEFSKSIECDGHKLLITESVETLLRQLRLPDVSRRLWIDGICINQMDLAERSNQVLMMKKIFSAPSRVLIWVGPEDDDTVPAIEQFSVWRIYTKDFSTYKNIEAVQRFTSRPWFRRVWTFQEACLPHDAVIICGSQHLPWMWVLEAAWKLIPMSMLQIAFGQAADSMFAMTMFSPVSEGYNRRKPDLLDLLRLGRNREATDDRDKVFGMLGLLPADEKAVVVPDYSMDVMEVYIHCARDILVRSGDLRLLSNCLGPVQNPSLPSWVPDWRVQRRTAVLQGFDWGMEEIKTYRLNGTQVFNSSPASVLSGKTLHQRGAYLGNVVSTHSPADFLQALSVGSSKFYYCRVDQRWNIFAPELRKLLRACTLPELYKQTGESSQTALLRTLAANRLPSAEYMREFVLGAARNARTQLLSLLRNIRQHMAEQKKDPAQLSFVKDLVEQMKNDDPSVDYSSVLAFSYEYVEQTPGLGPGRVGFREVKGFANRKDDHIPPEWVATLLAIYTRQKESLDDEAATNRGKEASLQDVKDFLTVCDLAWSILDYPLHSFGGGSAQAFVPARQELFQDKRGGGSAAAGVVDKMGSNMLTFSSARVVFKTDNGLIGLGPDYMSEGDEVWDLVGGDVPFLLRQETSDSDHGDRRQYRLVGECYVHGIMSGELWEDDSNQGATSSLRGKDLKFETIEIV